MELADKDRDAFLKRIGAIQKLRADGAVVPGVYVQEDGKEWDDDDILMLISFGFERHDTSNSRSEVASRD